MFEPIRGSSLEYASISIDNFEFLDEYCGKLLFLKEEFIIVFFVI